MEILLLRLASILIELQLRLKFFKLSPAFQALAATPSVLPIPTNNFYRALARPKMRFFLRGKLFLGARRL